MSKPSPARYRTTNWSGYTASLRKRGSLLIPCPASSSPAMASGRPESTVFRVAGSGCKVHLALDNATSDIRRCHTAIIDRRATPIIPIRKNGRPWTEGCPAAIARNETLHATRHYGRAFWKRWTGYHARSRIEAKMPSQVLLNL